MRDFVKFWTSIAFKYTYIYWTGHLVMQNVEKMNFLMRLAYAYKQRKARITAKVYFFWFFWFRKLWFRNNFNETQLTTNFSKKEYSSLRWWNEKEKSSYNKKSLKIEKRSFRSYIFNFFLSRDDVECEKLIWYSFKIFNSVQ